MTITGLLKRRKNKNPRYKLPKQLPSKRKIKVECAAGHHWTTGGGDKKCFFCGACLHDFVQTNQATSVTECFRCGILLTLDSWRESCISTNHISRS